jgi:hypothetical protein
MKVVIDTSSLLSLVRYYLPFDKKSVLINFFKERISVGEIIIIDKILEECEFVSKGLVLKTLIFLKEKPFLKENKLPINTEYVLPPSPIKFYRQVDNQFINGIIKNKLSPVEYENMKNNFLNSADMKLILYCLNLKKEDSNEEIFLITEETEDSNDSKVFKKIPAICNILEIETMTLPQFLGKYYGIDVEFNINQYNDSTLFQF